MNIWFLNSTSLITALIFLGDVFAADISWSVHNNLIIQFLEELVRFIIENIENPIDNASIHWCKQVIDYIERKSLKFSYSPEMTPVKRYF